MKNSIFIKAFYPNFYSDDLISYVSLRLIRYFNNQNVVASIMGITSDKSVRKYYAVRVRSTYSDREYQKRSIYRNAIPFWIWYFVKRIFSSSTIQKISELRFFLSLNTNDVVYLWPGTSINLYRKIRKFGCIVVTEMINTMQSTSKSILDKEFSSLNLPPCHNITERNAKRDIYAANLSDFIFSPSPLVSKSIRDAGISNKKILSTTYGLKKIEILGNSYQKTNKNKKFEFLFVGQICIRKGVHLLLDAWCSLNIDAKLRVIGRISPEISDLFNNYLNSNTNIEHVRFTKNLTKYYREADVFILPSLEEGSPLVTYLALGASLPVIASEMGAGGVITHDVEGILIDPHNKNNLIYAMTDLFVNKDRYHRMSLAAGKKAHQFTWNRVADQRRKLLLENINIIKTNQ